MYGQARNRLASSFNNPIGGSYSPNMRDAMSRSGNRDLLQQESQAEGEANADLQGAQYGQKYSLASLTAPRTQTSSGQYFGNASGTGTSATSQPMWPDLVGAGVTGAAL